MNWRLPIWKLWVKIEKIASDELAVRMIYRRRVGRWLRLHPPRSFTEKIQWMKLNYRIPVMPVLADKFTVRPFVAQRIGEQVLNELYGVWDRPEQIPFDALPDRYALKVTSASHQNLFCKTKGALDPNAAKAKLTEWMKQSFYQSSREWAYKDCSPRIVCEKFIDDGTGNSPIDYKFFCFDGKPQLIEVAIGRHKDLTLTMLDLNWNRLPFGYDRYARHPTEIPSPTTLGEMIDFAGRLSAGFPFMRVDFYCIENKTLFSEITWYPGSGQMSFMPFKYDLEIGALLGKFPAAALK